MRSRLDHSRRWMLATAGSALLSGCLMLIYQPAAGSAPPAEEPGQEPTQDCRSAGSGAQANAALNTQERELAMLLERDPGQQRDRIVLNPILARVARQRAQDMASRNYFSHTDPDGFAANYHVTRAGYRLPDFYNRSPAGNNIESIGAGHESVADRWNGWMRSTGHRTHLLGLQSFYRDQSEYGVGYAYSPNSQYRHYWVVLIAKPAC